MALTELSETTIELVISSPVVVQDLACAVQGAKPPSSASAEGASREGIQRPSSFSLPLYGVALLPRRSNRVVRRSPRVRRCSNATRSVQRRLCPSVEPVGVGHSEPPSEGQRPWSLEPLWGRSLHVPTPKQEAPTSRTEARSADGVDRGSSPLVSGGYPVDFRSARSSGVPRGPLRPSLLRTPPRLGI